MVGMRQLAKGKNVLVIDADIGQTLVPCPPCAERFEVSDEQVGIKRLKMIFEEFVVYFFDLRQLGKIMFNRLKRAYQPSL